MLGASEIRDDFLPNFRDGGLRVSVKVTEDNVPRTGPDGLLYHRYAFVGICWDNLLGKFDGHLLRHFTHQLKRLVVNEAVLIRVVWGSFQGMTEDSSSILL